MLTAEELRKDPEYAQAASEYEAAKIVNANDELGLLRAENQWIKREQELRGKIQERTTVEARRTEVIAKVKEEYPFVPESLYNSIDDPEQLLKVVAELGEKFDQGVQNSVNNWGPTTAGPDTTTRKTRANQERQALIDQANKNDPVALEKYKRLVWDERVGNSPFLQRNTRRPAATK